jgi:hypothetical protein
MTLTSRRVRKSALRFCILGASIIFAALFIGTMVGIGTHDSGFIYVFLAEWLGAVFIGVAALFLLASVFFPRPID